MKKRKLILLSVLSALTLFFVMAAIYTGSDYYKAGRQQIKNREKGNAQDIRSLEATKETQDQRTEKPDATGKEQNVPQANQNSTENISKFKDIKVKAIYLTGPSAGNKKVIERVIQLARTTELNAVVVDIKEAGMVNYISDVPAVKQNKLFTSYFDPEEVVSEFHDNNIYVIGRIVCFRDNGLASKRADLAVKRPDGTLWREGKIAWTNPYNEEVWRYNIDIAKEAVSKGVDEIQFDYVRFPTARSKDIDYGGNVPSKTEAINGFLSLSAKELQGAGNAKVSADVFGIICESPKDGEAIGQNLEKIGTDIDYISPMIYPSHYANASKGMMGNGYGQTINGVHFTAPDLKPYEVVYNTLMRAKDRLSKITGYKARVRPYLQDFTASYIKDTNYYQVYGPKQVREQIKAVYDAGYEEWILWNGGNVYSEGAFLKK